MSARASRRAGGDQALCRSRARLSVDAPLIDHHAHVEETLAIGREESR